jgi:16S rRNA (cytosine1402-N4)-methyltransferase
MPVNESQIVHRSVLLDETIAYFDSVDGGTIIDATLGMGGHAEAILEKNSNVAVLGLDQDRAAIDIAAKRLERFGSRVKIVKSNFSEINSVVKGEGVNDVSGILADLGVSSLQFDSESRGFSFRFDAPLDMRMDAASDDPTAAELLEQRSEEEIANIIYQYGEERKSRRIARWIVERRKRGEPVRTTKQLADLVASALRKGPKEKIHPATRTFQALRIAVNRELEILDEFLTDSVELLKKDGIFAVITFHSLEDRIVKQAFQRLSGKCSCPPRMPTCICGAAKRVEVLTRKPVTPSEEETEANPRSRSAKLRVVRKLV